MKKTSPAKAAMLLAVACCSFSDPARAWASEPISPASESVSSEGASRLTGTAALDVVLAILFGGAVLYGLYDVLFDEDNEDQPASP